MFNVLGYDVGGANTKAALVNYLNGEIINSEVLVEYFPIWKKHENLSDVFLSLKKRTNIGALDGIGVTMTAELSDAYQTKREGVICILDCLRITYPNTPIYVLNVEAELESIDLANREPLRVAAANWAATGWLVSQYLENCVVVDVGSTSSSLIPIINGKVKAYGKTDLDKLLCGELVYTGSLRTNVAAIVQSIPIKNGVASVASELFALSGDVHLVLNNITERDYLSETADGRGKTVPEALARLARVVCADTEILTQREIIQMAHFICEEQIRQVTVGLSKVYAYTKSLTQGKIPIVATGLGRKFIARKAAEIVKVDKILDLETILPEKAVLATPAFGVALMVAKKLERGPLT